MKRIIATLAALLFASVGSHLYAQAPTQGLFLSKDSPDNSVFKRSTWMNGLPVFSVSKIIDDGTNLFYNTFRVPQLTLSNTVDGCATFVSNKISSTGSPCGSGGGGAVSSVFGRTGAVTAQNGDYTAVQVGALPIAGGTLTGALTLAADPTTNLQAATKQYVDNHSGSGGCTTSGSTILKGNGSGGCANALSGDIVTTLNTSPTLYLNSALLPPLTTANSSTTPASSGTLIAPQVDYDANGKITSIRGVLHPSYTIAIFGDSFDANYGAAATTSTSAAENGYGSLAKKDTPTMTPWLGNLAVQGTRAGQIAASVLAGWPPNATYPSTAFIGSGGENEYTWCPSGSTACVSDFSRAAAAQIYWASIAPQQRTLMSNVSGTGTCNTNPATTLIPINPLTGNASGSAVTCNVGATKTFTVPATNNGEFGIYGYYPTGTATTATYTVSVDGTLQTDSCSGTTTFTVVGCNAAGVGSNGPQRIRFAVSAGSSHSVTITTGGTATTTLIAWDYTDSTLALNTNAVLARNAGASFDVTGWTATALASVVSQAHADGLPVMLVDARAALLALPDGGVSMTSTATYVGSTLINHPRNGGHLAMEQAMLQSQVANNYIVSVVGAGTPEPDNTVDRRVTALGIPFTGSTNYPNTWTGIYRNYNYDNDSQYGGFIDYPGANTGLTPTTYAIVHRIGNGTHTLGSGAYFEFALNLDVFCTGKYTTPNLTAESNFAQNNCADANGNSAQKGYHSATQFVTTGSNPTIAIGTGAGTSPGTPTITGNNMDGVITIITGTSAVGGSTLATITFNGTLGVAPNHCTLQSINSAGSTNFQTVFTTTPTTTGWTIGTASIPPADSATMQWGYSCR